MVLSLSACGDSTSTNGGGGSTETVAPGASAEVKLKGEKFNPADITVAKGTTVTWSNDDSIEHTVTADGGAFNSGTIKSGVNFGYTFNEAGVFEYHCSIHPTMKGKVTVTE